MTDTRSKPRSAAGRTPAPGVKHRGARRGRRGSRLRRAFYARPTLEVARDLLGCTLVRMLPDGERLAGRIVETEAYVGKEDRACHASAGRTERAAVLFERPGTAYVYMIYGMHFLLNAVTEPRDRPAAVLMRAIEPLEGLAAMARHRGLAPLDETASLRQRVQLTSGPGRLAQALHVDRRLNRVDLTGDVLFIEAARPDSLPAAVRTTPRIGVDYAGEWKDRPWRFIEAGNPFVSGPRELRGGGSVGGRRRSAGGGRRRA